jgi:hypothetical protein
MGCGASAQKPPAATAKNESTAPERGDTAPKLMQPPQSRSTLSEDVRDRLRRKSINVLAQTGLVPHEVEALVDVMNVPEL